MVEDGGQLTFLKWDTVVATTFNGASAGSYAVDESNKIVKNDCPKRPKVLPGEVFHGRVHGEDYFVLIGLHFGEPYEIFAGKNTAGIQKNLKMVNIKNYNG